MKRLSQPRIRGEGQALVEFALVLPILLLVVIGGLYMLLLLMDYDAIAYAAESGATEAARRGGNPNGETVEWVRDRLGDQLGADRVAEATITVSPANAQYGEVVEVTVALPFRVNVIRTIYQGTMEVTRSSRAAREVP